jgi:hypothetical protein
MTDPVEALILDLLEWLVQGQQSYDQVMDAWRTSCPRLPVWEDANDRGLVQTDRSTVRITPLGVALLEKRGRRAPDVIKCGYDSRTSDLRNAGNVPPSDPP